MFNMMKENDKLNSSSIIDKHFLVRLLMKLNSTYDVTIYENKKNLASVQKQACNIRAGWKKIKGGKSKKLFVKKLGVWIWSCVQFTRGQVVVDRLVRANVNLRNRIKALSNEVNQGKKDVTTLRDKIKSRDTIIERFRTNLKNQKFHKARQCVKKNVWRKNECLLSSRQKIRRKLSRQAVCKTALLDALDDPNYVPILFSLQNIVTKKVDMHKCDEHQEVDRGQISDVDRIISVCDNFGISQDAYHELTMLCPLLPRSHLVKTRIAVINAPLARRVHEFTYDETSEFLGVRLELEYSLKR